MRFHSLRTSVALLLATLLAGCMDTSSTDFCNDGNGPCGPAEVTSIEIEEEASASTQQARNEAEARPTTPDNPGAETTGEREEAVVEEADPSEARLPEDEQPPEENDTPVADDTPRETGDTPEEPATEESVQEEEVDPAANNQAPAVVEVVKEEIELLPPPQALGRERKRMNIDQLDKAIESVTGGLRWKETPASTEGMFEVLALSLGKPDYRDQTHEDLEPGALFQKFLGDAARSVCSELLSLELERSPEERVFLVHTSGLSAYEDAPDDVEDNLLYLLERFHGTELVSGSPGMNSWLWLFESATLVSQDPSVAWNTVCVGLIQHPHFYSY